VSSRLWRRTTPLCGWRCNFTAARVHRSRRCYRRTT